MLVGMLGLRNGVGCSDRMEWVLLLLRHDARRGSSVIVK